MDESGIVGGLHLLQSKYFRVRGSAVSLIDADCVFRRLHVRCGEYSLVVAAQFRATAVT